MICTGYDECSSRHGVVASVIERALVSGSGAVSEESLATLGRSRHPWKTVSRYRSRCCACRDTLPAHSSLPMESAGGSRQHAFPP
jgi:hypothetical protein